MLPDGYAFCEQKNIVHMLAFVQYFCEAYVLFLMTLYIPVCAYCDHPFLRLIWNLVRYYSTLVTFSIVLKLFQWEQGQRLVGKSVLGTRISAC